MLDGLAILEECACLFAGPDGAEAGWMGLGACGAFCVNSGNLKVSAISCPGSFSQLL